MESDDPKEEAQNDDKWDIVILHNDSQTELAEAVRESIKAICQTLGRPYRVEIFEDLLGAGQMHTVVFDDVLENTGVIMFFRNEEFFSEPLREFDIGTALNDRITHIETRRHWTVVPLDIEKKTKVRGKPSINGSQGLIITAEGDIKERNEERKQKKINELLDRACSTSSSRHAAHRSPEQSIAEGREQQLRQISALMPDASDTDAARASPSDASHAASAGTFGSDSQPLPDRRITQRSGLSRHTFHNDGRECQAVTTEGGSQLFQNNFSGRPNQNRPEVSLSNTMAEVSGAPNAFVRAHQGLPTNTTGYARPPVSIAGEHTEALENNISCEENSVYLPHSVIPDNQSVRLPSAARPYPRTVGSDHQSQVQFQQPRHTGSHNVPLDRSEENQLQNEQCNPTDTQRDYWNRTGARPKTTHQISASTVPQKQGKSQETRSRTQEVGHTATEGEPRPSHSNHYYETPPRQIPSDSRNPNLGMAETFDEELQNVTRGLHETSLDSVTPQEDPSNSHRDQDPQVSPSRNHSVDHVGTSQQRQDSSLYDRQVHNCGYTDGAELPMDDLQVDASGMHTGISGTYRGQRDPVLTPHYPSTARAFPPPYSAQQYPAQQQLHRLQEQENEERNEYEHHQEHRPSPQQQWQQQQQQQQQQPYQLQQHQREVAHQDAVREEPEPEAELAELGVALVAGEHSVSSSEYQSSQTQTTDSGRGSM